MKEEKRWKMQDWIWGTTIFKNGEDIMAKIYFTLTGTNIITAKDSLSQE